MSSVPSSKQHLHNKAKNTSPNRKSNYSPTSY
ncbi:hypothetical protein LZT12_02750 [Vibrio fluvialis]|nr:hypothetical protein [Vibrio fluvialis]MCE7653621.1 hypothetical protein [Vibrio fluvialis]